MTHTLTREQVEAIQRDPDSAHPAVIFALCTLALERLDMEPRPISEALRDGTLILAFDADNAEWSIIYAYAPPKFYTHFIPLSSLPKVTT